MYFAPGKVGSMLRQLISSRDTLDRSDSCMDILLFLRYCIRRVLEVSNGYDRLFRRSKEA